MLTASLLYGETGQNESESGWFLHPQLQNWSCNVFAGKTPIGSGSGGGQCKANFISNLGYVYAQPVKVWNGSADKYYFYVQEWGAVEGPGSECWGDSILIFETPYTANGAKASGVNPIYRGTANPPEQCSATSNERSHWSFGSAFYDSFLGRVYLVGQRVRWDGGFNEIWLGESIPAANGSYGKSFTWSKLLQTNISGHSIYTLHVVPDTNAMIWRGFLDNSHQGGWGATPVIINRAQNTIQYKNINGTWTTIPVGGTMTDLTYIQQPGFTASFVKVNNRYELWYETKPLPGSQRPMVPCPDSPYLTNINTAGRGTNGNQLYYVVVDANLNPILGPLPQSSSTHPIPSNELWSTLGPHAANIVGLSGSTMYYGSNDWSICNVTLNDWNAWSGSGIKWGRLTVW